MNALAILAAVALTQGGELRVMPQVPLTDMEGKTVSLSGFLGKKVVLFNWASW